jgi:excisionase family DNA binding protein
MIRLMQRTMPESADPLIDREALGELLKVSGKTIQRMADEGRIPYFKVRGSYRFRAGEVLAALRGGPTPAEDTA